MSSEKLLMIPGPVEISAAVRKAFAVAPPSHLAPAFIEAFGASLEMMRQVWKASEDSEAFIVAGSGTIAMDMAVANLMEPGDAAVVVNTGYFSDRIAQMLRRRGVEVEEVGADPGDVPSQAQIDAALDQDVKAVFATHVDTSTGVRVDVEAVARVAREREVLSVFDGVCATGGERFEMADWEADVYLTASQKAIGVPPGLALMVVSPRALEARQTLGTPPPMSVDFDQWLPIMEAYGGGRPSYFSTPATNLVLALRAGLDEIVAYEYAEWTGIDARVELHRRSAEAMRAAWSHMGLDLFPARPELAANTMSAIMYPDGVDRGFLGRLAERGIVVAGGLYPGHKEDYFRVGHMGDVLTRPEALVRVVEAVGAGLVESGYDADPAAAVEVVRRRLR